MSEKMPDRIPLASVSATHISVEDCVHAVDSPATGAIVTFNGVVRDHDEGRRVVALRYSGHPTAALVIEQVAHDVSLAHPDVTIAVQHRIGYLLIGDTALACAVASSHRHAAFAACADLVDLVKERVPIWKEQEFGDGTAEWVNSIQ